MIERAEHSDGFTVINNDVLRDMELSDDARALFVYMLTMSDDWNFSVEGLAYLTQRSPRKIAKLVTELKRRGYIEQKTRTDEHGRFLPAEWVIHEEPITALHENRRAVKPQRGQTAERTDRRAVAPQSGKRVVIRNNNSKEITNIKEITKEKKERADDFSELLAPLSPELQETFNEFLKMRKKLKAPMTVKALDLAIKKAKKLGNGDQDKMRAIVEQSIMNSWRGLFALKEEPKPIKSTGNEFLDLLNKWEAEGNG